MSAPTGPTPDREVLLRQLRKVLDPEMDEPILDRGLIESLEAEAGRVTVRLRLPTCWCAPNFVYIMAEDVRRQLLQLDEVRDVTVRLLDHVDSGAIEAAVNAGRPFQEAFPQEAAGDLGELRTIFLRKGFMRRQEQLLRSLAGAGLSPEEIVSLEMRHTRVDGGLCRMELPVGEPRRAIPAGPLLRYLERRADLGLSCSPQHPLVTDLDDRPVSPARLPAYWREARMIRLAMDANAALCKELLEARTRNSHCQLVQIGDAYVSPR